MVNKYYSSHWEDCCVGRRFLCVGGLDQILKNGVYAASVIKKRRYWPKYVPGDDVDNKLKDNTIGKNRVMSGKLNNEKYNFFIMKEPAFIMKTMTTYGNLEEVDNQEITRQYFKDNNGNKVKRKVKYTTVF